VRLRAQPRRTLATRRPPYPPPPNPTPTPQIYKWDEPSREAIEGAFDTLLQAHYKQRRKTGFQPAGLRGAAGARGGGGGGAAGGRSLAGRLAGLFDPTVTARTVINEGAVFGAFALWCARGGAAGGAGEGGAGRAGGARGERWRCGARAGGRGTD
jgi:hypothetical protein